ncbi:MAG: Tyrosine recombinase XerC [Candidatus Jorgensenbacteria bacterium GW2011_GWA1_48_11]|uniref:Tyrosine recombinase XerC n=1 Tax=Candidatus Jorgensenbacteria bacterium GW2011_GWA1_48_11 TaxID=1618660 RepID=A0A0G1UBV9_9BACT|nr:MAG: Tyrosine recombinase XerC [Candidatus Jorgensenbacteria bacterium GW2011_GWA1_48_11]
MVLMTEVEKLVKDYLAYLEIEKNRSPKTRENYERYLKAFLREVGPRLVRDITAEAVRDFRLKLARQNIKKITQSYYVIALRNFLKYLIKRNIKALSPETIELPKVSRRDIEVLDYGELERLLKAPEEALEKGKSILYAARFPCAARAINCGWFSWRIAPGLRLANI